MVSPAIRTVTDQEVAHCRDHGWVRLDQLISADVAAELLERAKVIMGPDASQHVGRPEIDALNVPWQDHHNVIEEDPSFAAVGLSAKMGENAQRLMRRDVGVLLYNNDLAVKIGTKQGPSAQASAPTHFHQDGAPLPIDRAGRIAFWIALDHITPEMGLVRYVDSSHHLGSLGYLAADQRPLFDVYPELQEMSLTEPMAFKPGDAAAHTMYTVHDAPANETDRPRWSFIISYIPSDTIYTGSKTVSQGTQNKITRAGLAAGEPFGGPAYPRVFG
jgi:hypothetical protein